MKWKNFKLGTKLKIAFGTIVGILGVVSIISFIGINRIELSSKYNTKIKLLSEQIKERHIDHLKWTTQLGQFLNDENSDHLSVEQNPHKCAFGKWYYGAHKDSAIQMIPELDTLFKNLEQPHLLLHQSATEIEQLHKSSDIISARTLYKSKTLVQLDTIGHLIDKIKETYSERINEVNEEVDTQIKDIETGVLFAIIFALAAAIILSIIITRGIVKPIQKSVEFTQAVAKGDLNVTIDDDREDEIGQLLGALSKMVKEIKHIVDSILNESNKILDSSNNISQASSKISIGATEQAASIEEISSSMEEMAANIQQNSENAKTTENITGNSLNGMKKLSLASDLSSDSVKEINDKITMINDIALQTNILALNASVEAARAGNEGKGFAVVAGEVRKLAEQSKAIAKEIVDLAEKSMVSTEETNTILHEIKPEIDKSAMLVKEISTASFEQNSGTDQINSAIQELNKVAQQNASSAEQMASDSSALEKQSNQLRKMVSYFQTK